METMNHLSKVLIINYLDYINAPIEDHIDVFNQVEDRALNKESIPIKITIDLGWNYFAVFSLCSWIKGTYEYKFIGKIYGAENV